MMNTLNSTQPTPSGRRSTSSLLVTFVAAFLAAIGVLLVSVQRTDAQVEGGAWAWGQNVYGQLGDGTTTQRNAPVRVGGLSSGVQDIEGGFYHSLALKIDGTGETTVWVWGRNDFGQLGVGTTTTRRNAPVQVGGLSSVQDIAAGHSHSLALKSNGTVWAWGKNEYSELGDGTTTDRSTPVQVLSEVKAVAGGQLYTLALKNDGTVLAWGRNNFGQLGTGTTTDSNTPVQVLSDVKAIGTGYAHSLALKNDGTLWAWGKNEFGELGAGTTTNRNTPVQVRGFSDEQAIIDGGYRHSLALKSDGTVWAWGRNKFGQLGAAGTITQRNAPVQVRGISGVQDVDAGGNHNLAIR